MEAGFGVNSPEFLQKKIERLKTALDEANALMDRQVTERDEARAQLDAAKRENDDLKRRLAAAGGGGDDLPAAGSSEVEEELRARISELEAERSELQAGRPAEEQELRSQIDSLQYELSTARRQLQDAHAEAAAGAPARAGSVPAGRGDGDLPTGGPFVSADAIREALANDGFVLFAQPVFSLQAERITQYELLLRLRDADGRMVRPFGFLEPADRYGLMAQIDRWVVGQALDLLANDSTGDLRLEVNLAGQSLGDPDLTALIEQQIAVTDLDPGRLILEVNENVAVAHLEDCEKLAKRLRGLGCGFALDDFGSTFASFRHLRDLPVNYLKIDGDLVVTVTESRTGQLTIKSLVELAKGLGAETIAEYVSDDQTLEFLREQGVSYAQGYRIGRPRPIEEVLGVSSTPERKPAKGGGRSSDAESESEREGAPS
jgi:EAL domain-containing protein (putative c-di-GMP-specific phosphodiesterase class I)/outer membrane murein-binding lipoprotein Lpp